MRFLLPDRFDRLLMSRAQRRPVYLATLDQNIINTFEMDRAFHLFADQAHERKH